MVCEWVVCVWYFGVVGFVCEDCLVVEQCVRAWFVGVADWGAVGV